MHKLWILSIYVPVASTCKVVQPHPATVNLNAIAVSDACRQLWVWSAVVWDTTAGKCRRWSQLCSIQCAGTFLNNVLPAEQVLAEMWRWNFWSDIVLTPLLSVTSRNCPRLYLSYIRCRMCMAWGQLGTHHLESLCKLRHTTSLYIVANYHYGY